MKRPLVDINVLLDALGRREPFWHHAARIWSAAETGRIEGLVSADSFSTTYYLLRRHASHRTALRGMQLIRDTFSIVSVDTKVISQAIDSPVRDFEDAIQYHCALHGNADCLVTRDLRHYRNADLPVFGPENFLSSLDA